MINWYRERLNPPYSRKDLIPVFGTILILIAIPLTVYATLTARGLQPKASSSIRGVVGDLWADVIIGQSDFGEIMPYPVAATRSFNSGGCAIDNTNNRMYIFDANNRILGLDLTQSALTAPDPPNWFDGLGAVAQIVIGQPDMFTSAANGDSGYQNYPTVAPATAKSLAAHHEDVGSVGEAYYASSMAFANGALYVADLANNRVLKYADPWQNYPAADDVWGQDDFVSRLPNKNGTTTPSATSLSLAPGGHEAFMSGVDVDSAGALWVADTRNNRIVRFPPGSKTANLVLGQPGFTTPTSGSGLAQFNRPLAVRVSPTNGYVYVADRNNDRVIRFRPPFSSGMSGEVFGSGIERPTGVDFDPGDPGNVWIMNQAPLQGVRKFSESDGTLLVSLSSIISNSLGDVCFAPNGDKYATGLGWGGPIRIKAGVPTDGYWGRSIFGTTGAVFAPTLHSPAKTETVQGVAVQDNQVIVADWGRILAWDNPEAVTSGQAAAHFAGGDGAISDYDHPRYGAHLAMRGDDAHHIWVPHLDGHIAVYQTPLVSGASPVAMLYPPFNALGGGSLSFTGPFAGVHPSPDGSFVWLAHPDTNRVIRIRDPLSPNPLVDVVLGQTTLAGTAPNQGGSMTMSTLMYPGKVALDRLGNVWVSDHANEGRGNHRLLMYPAPLFPPDGTSIVFASAATKAINNVSTYEVAFDSLNQMVVTYSIYGANGPQNGRFAAVYLDPLSIPNGSSTTQPDFLLSDFGTFTSVWFDNADNLYVGDAMRSRVLIYKRPITPEPPDTQNPTVSITSPSDGETVSGTVGVSADADDNIDVTKVEFYLDGDLKSTDVSSPYSWSWDSTAVSDGDYILTAKAYDAADNEGTSDPVNVTVNNTLPPNLTVDVKANSSNGPITVVYNTAATLSWTSTNATSCAASNGWSGSKATSGSESTGNLTASKTYTLTCTGPGGNATDSVSVNVGKLGDLNLDGSVNIRDFGIFLGKWGTADQAADFNKDGTVNIRDFGIFLGKWGS